MGIKGFRTERGSVYTYLPDGRTQRFKAATGEQFDPQRAIVFVPPYEWAVQNCPQVYRDAEIFGENSLQYEQILLEYVQGRDSKVYIVDSKGNKLEDNVAVAQADKVLLAFVNRDGKCDFHVAVSKTPIKGWSPFDTNKKDGMREIHLGHKVVEVQDGRE